MKHCSIDGCENGVLARGWCSMHWQRNRKHGDPLALRRHTDPEAAFLARTEPLVWSSCIVWTGALNGGGYGRIWIGGRYVGAHRYAWEREHGPVPDGMFLDHRCYERSCVNVDHLRLATPQENGANRSGAMPGRSLPRGVYRNGRGYSAQVRHSGTLHHLGTFDTPEAASIAAQNKRALLYGEFAGRA